MAALLNPNSTNTDDDANNQTTGVNTDTSGGGGSGSGSTAGSTSGANPNPVGGTTPKQPDTASPNVTNTKQIADANSGFDFSPLLDSVRGQGTAARGAIDTANNTFQSGLGAKPTFDSTQTGILDNVLTGKDTNLADGTNILNLNTTAPTPVNNGMYDPLVAQYQTSAQQTGSQQGLTSLLQSLRPDLTPGDLAYDSTAYFGNPNYQSQTAGIQQDANDVGNLASTITAGDNNAIKQRAADVAAFQQAAKAYVQNQLTGVNTAMQNQLTAANNYDAGIQSYLNSGLRSASGLVGQPGYAFNFDPNQYAEQDFAGTASGYGGLVNPFDEKVNPNNFLTYNSGQLPTLQNSATPDEITLFNNANALLGSPNQMTGGTRTAASIGIDNAAWQAALNKAISDRNASDIAWLAAHQPPPLPAPSPQQPFQPELADPKLSSGGADGGNGADAGADSGGNGSGEGGESGGGDAGGEGGDGGGDGGEGGGFHKGGLVRRNYFRGGAVPQNAGPPGIDTVPTAVNNGEYVIQAPSTLSLGVSNLNGLNHLNAATPVQQQAVKNALHTALSRLTGTRKI